MMDINMIAEFTRKLLSKELEGFALKLKSKLSLFKVNPNSQPSLINELNVSSWNSKANQSIIMKYSLIE